MAAEFRSLFPTPFGTGSVSASGQGIVKVDLPDRAVPVYEPPEAAARYQSSRLTEYAALQLGRYFSGERVDFRDIAVDLSGVTPFRRNLLLLIREVAYGTVRTYGQIACAGGSPGAARAVGGAMASNPVPVIIPCHRIVGGSGRLTGFSAPGGVDMKRELLRMEHVEFKGLLVARNQLVINK